MLSRHAESMFWIGRYMERAENTARMLDVTYHSALEAGSERTSNEVWGDLFEILMLDEDEVRGIDGGRSLIFDTDLPFSIRSIATSARENARGNRELLSAEVWEAVNSLHLGLQDSARSGVHEDRPYDVLRQTKALGQTFTGAVVATMSRGDGFRFLLIGQLLERAATTLRALCVWNQRLSQSNSSTAHAEWVKLLKSVSGHEAYLRTHQAQISTPRVVEFLMHAEEFPRSVLFCLRHVEDRLLPMVVDGVGEMSRRSVGMVRSNAEFSLPYEMDPDDLDRLITDLESAVLELTHAIEHDFFRPGSAIMRSYEAF